MKIRLRERKEGGGGGKDFVSFYLKVKQATLTLYFKVMEGCSGEPFRSAGSWNRSKKEAFTRKMSSNLNMDRFIMRVEVGKEEESWPIEIEERGGGLGGRAAWRKA